LVRGLNHGEEIAKPLRDYEILYIVRPDVEEADLPDTTKKVESLIESLGGSVQRTNIWGKRRLAYEVSHLREGHYVLTDFEIDAGRVPEMEATLKISDQVFRHLIVRKPPATPAPTAAPPPPAEAAESAAVETAAPTEPDGGQPQEPVVATGSTEASEVEEEGDNGQP